jgi:hypothetical protein
MNLLKWLLWGPRPSNKEIERAIQASPRDESLERRAQRISKKLGGR